VKVVTSLLLALLALPLLASPADPADVLSQARSHIANKQYREAAQELTPALDAADAIADPATRTQAVAAVHFYSAVAYSGLREDAQATKHLREYLEVTPKAHAIDPAKYEPHFVALFNDLMQTTQTASGFNVYYPGFGTFAALHTKYIEPDAFGPNPALLILGSKAEQQQFRSLFASAARAKFIEDFWKRRDPTPGTPRNEFQEAFNRRAVFADQAFATIDGLGSMTDRGKVFILLGEPAYIRRRPISERDAIVIFDNPIINGQIEQWIYTRDQMPMKLSKPRVMYRFVTQEGIGDHVLQRQEDAYAMQALAVAGNPQERK
jgi:GWxTD domain-containing protein